jgi:uncharacterized protein
MHNPAPVVDVDVERDVLVVMRDGVRLATDVFRLATGGPFPVVLKRTPYGKKATELMAAESIADLVDHGYAVVVQDVRGRFNSEGRWIPFATEKDDAYDTIAWAAQQPWSTARVGMFGGSYLGLTQVLAAAAAPPALRAIAPANSAADLHRDWVYAADGVLDLLLSVGWSAVVVSDTARRAGVRDDTLQDVERAFGEVLVALAHNPERARAASMQLRSALDPLLRAPERLGALAPWIADWTTHPTRDQYWSELSPSARYSTMCAPGLHVAGWYDPFLTGVLSNFAGMQPHAPQRLIVGPWLHASFEPCPPHHVGELDFSPVADFDFPDLQRRWFDYWLKDVDNGVLDEAPVRVFVMGDNRWRDESAWPLARTSWTRWFLHSDNLLSASAPDEGAHPGDTLLHDPADPVPTLGGAVLPGAVAAGPFDQHSLESRPDVLMYASETLTAAREVTGPVEAVLWVASAASESDFVARLVDVYPDGRAINLCEGVARSRGGELRIEMRATSNVFAAGHRIGLHVASSSYPHYAPNPRPARQSVFHDAARPSHLRLPIIPR